MSQARVVPFRRPLMVVFVRFNPDDMSAVFKAPRGSDTYHFTLLGSGRSVAVWEPSVEHEDGSVTLQSDLDVGQRSVLKRLVREAREVVDNQLSTWGTLTPQERISLLIHWGEERIVELERAITAAAIEGPRRYAREIAGMYADLENQQVYLDALRAARSVF